MAPTTQTYEVPVVTAGILPCTVTVDATSPEDARYQARQIVFPKTPLARQVHVGMGAPYVEIGQARVLTT